MESYGSLDYTNSNSVATHDMQNYADYLLEDSRDSSLDRLSLSLDVSFSSLFLHVSLCIAQRIYTDRHPREREKN